MLRADAGRVGAALAQARRSSRAGDVDLSWLTSMQEACEVQDAAIDCFGAAPIGYTLAATTAVTSRLLVCSKPIIGKLLTEYVYESGSTIRLPHETLGLGAQFVFVMGAPIRKPIDLRSVSDSILSCRMGLQLLGRRAGGNVPLNDRSATADFALDVGCVLGSPVEGWREIGSKIIEVSLLMNGNELARGLGTEVFGDPIAALVDLAQSLSARGGSLEAGDVVATGSCTGLTQAIPGQRVEAVFEGYGSVQVYLT